MFSQLLSEINKRLPGTHRGYVHAGADTYNAWETYSEITMAE